MDKILEKIKLIEFLTTELDIEQSKFVTLLKENIAPSDLGMFSDTSDLLSFNTYNHKGQVNFDGFKIKRRRRIFDMAINFAIAEGKFQQIGSKLIIETKITGVSKLIIPFFILIILLYVFIIGDFLITTDYKEDLTNSILVFLFFILHGFLMLGIPYFMMRKGVKNMKYELNREFHYLIKK